MNLIRKLSDNTKDYLDTFNKILHNLKEEMNSAEVTESISQTFINQMIPYHEGAVRMSENILNYTTDVDIEGLAKTIIEEQTAEISRLRCMLDDCSLINNCERDFSLYLLEFKKIFNQMINGMESSRNGNNLEVDFLSEMIPHHRGGILMSKNLLRFDVCDELREFTERLITSRNQQLNEMEKMMYKLQR